MNRIRSLIPFAAVMAALALTGRPLSAQAQEDEPPPLGFFITSVGIGDGGNLGGLDGADAHCQTLAAAAGAGDRTWRAYLSTQGGNGVDARGRIGEGPWANTRRASSSEPAWRACITTTRISTGSTRSTRTATSSPRG